MTIEEIYYSEEISVRSFNVCNDNDLKDLSAILKHYRENRTFENLKNCGRKSNEELTALCLKYTDYDNNHLSEPLEPEKQLITTITNFTRTQREVVNSFIEINSNNLSNRSKNAITTFLNGNLKIRNISEKILTNDRFNFQDIKNVGKKTVTELKSFIDSIIEFITKVAEVGNENDLVALRNRFFIEKTFSISSIPNEILESQSIFSLVDFLISKDAIFEKNENLIFKKGIKIYNDQPELTLDDIADEIKISRERVRQIRKGILENLFNNLQFVRNIEDDLYQKYDIDQNHHFINIDDDLNNLINTVNNTNFSVEFNTIIIYSYISDKFDLIGEIEDVLQPKTFNSRGRHNWDNFYLVSKGLTNLFDFNNLVDDIDKRLNDRIEETYWFHFKSYLTSFMKVDDNSLITLILPVAEKILNKEFDLIIDLNDNIIFKRNTVKQVPEFAIEALEKLGVPSNIEAIYKLIEKEFPEITKSKEALRGSLQRTPEIIYFGRSSTYGLKKWETEKDGIKGGTIRSIVIKFLELESEPIHISKISKHVLQYRPDSNEKSIYYNLKMDESNSFIFYKDSHVGLIQKNYDKAFEKISNDKRIEKKSWEERYTELSGFIAVNNRLPFSSGCPENEIKLYRWYKIQVGKTKNGRIEEEKGNLINEIIKNFEKGESTQRTSTNNIGRIKKVSSNSKYTYEYLTEFISINKRMPDSRDPNESRLYQYYYRNKKNLENIDELSVQEAKLLELIEKFGSSKHPKHTIDELMEFIKSNKRMPDSRKNNERGLYQFAYKQRKLFEEGDLDKVEVNKFVEIAKIIQNHKYENKRN